MGKAQGEDQLNIPMPIDQARCQCPRRFLAVWPGPDGIFRRRVLLLSHAEALFCIRSVAVRVIELFDMLPGMHTVSVLFLLVRNLKVSHNSGISRRILWWKMSHLIIRYEAVACDRGQLLPISGSTPAR